MKQQTSRLQQLKEDLYHLTKSAKEGKIAPNVAAEKIIELREEIDAITKQIGK